MLDAERWRDVALDLADAADRLALAGFRSTGLAVRRKADGSYVTSTDRDVETLLRERLAAIAPDHAVLGEEQGGAIDPDVPTWVLDPIDATHNYLRGVPVFATLLALVDGGEPVAGVVSAPALGTRWDAYTGGGARRDGAPVRVSDVSELARAQVLHGGLEWWRGSARQWEALGRLADTAERTRGFGDFWMHLLVAGGAAEVAVERDLKPWDIAAVACVVTEAGGRMTAYDGRSSSMATGEALTTNGLVHDEVVAVLACDAS